MSEEQNRFFFTKSKLLTSFDFPANQDNNKKKKKIKRNKKVHKAGSGNNSLVHQTHFSQIQISKNFECHFIQCIGCPFDRVKVVKEGRHLS